MIVGSLGGVCGWKMEKGFIVGMNGYDMFRLFRWIFVGFYNANPPPNFYEQVESGPQSILGQPWLDSFNLLLSKR